MSNQNELNPQPLPPSVDVGHLTETVTRAIQSALTQTGGRSLIVNPRIIVGIIAEPQLLRQLEGGESSAGG